MTDSYRGVAKPDWMTAEQWAEFTAQAPDALRAMAEARAEIDAMLAQETIEPFCACGRVTSRCDGSRAGCHKTARRAG